LGFDFQKLILSLEVAMLETELAQVPLGFREGLTEVRVGG
jgi:hypothetical protein